MRFADIIGLDDTKSALINAVNTGHISHAQLFLGNTGTANMALALAYATYIHCENRQPQDSCGTCSSCHKVDKLIHPDLLFVYPVTSGDKQKESTEVKYKEEWRAFLIQNPYPSFDAWANFVGEAGKQFIISKDESMTIIRNLYLKSFESEYKIMMLWLPELMNNSAANVILKILEEPPPKTIFLLVAGSAEQMLTTILSRTQILRIKPFEDRDIAQFLESRKQIGSARAAEIALMADGDLNHALKLCEESDNSQQDFFATWMRRCLKREYAELVKLADNYSRFSKEAQKSFWLYALRVYRESMMVIVGEERLLKVSDAQRDFVGKFSTVLTMTKLEQMVTDVSEAQYHIERNANPKIIFLDTSLLMTKTFHTS